MSKATQKYLAIYAEPESRLLQNFPDLPFDRVLVIPCFRESPAFALRLQGSLLAQHRVLVIVVINQPPGARDPLNENLLTFFKCQEILWQNANLRLCRATHQGSCWLVVDRFTEGRWIDTRQGVGLARKIGCDLAVQLMELGICRDSWIFTSDADAHLPRNYFSDFSPCENSSAAVFATRHIHGDDSAVLAATALYEQALDYYVRGLVWAGSLYGFPTIGSAVAVRARHYCQARGFPKRAGGEDFYLLNKLAKLGNIERVPYIRIEIEARLSDRVPFGTGPAVSKIFALEKIDDFAYYSPEVFVALKSWLDRIPQLWPALQSGEDPLQGLEPEIVDALENAEIHTLWRHLRRQVKSAEGCTTAAHHWFDAFRTLKFIRYLQETRFPPVPLAHALQTAEFMRNTDL
jgi:hypothetical protein